MKEAGVTDGAVMDKNQIGIEWIEIENIMEEPLFPVGIRSLINSYSKGTYIKTYLGKFYRISRKTGASDTYLMPEHIYFL